MHIHAYICESPMSIWCQMSYKFEYKSHIHSNTEINTHISRPYIP